MVGKAVSPGVTRIFRADKDGVDSTKKLIIEFAESEGWVYSRSISDDNSWWARKTIGKFDLVIIIRSSPMHDGAVEIEII